MGAKIEYKVGYRMEMVPVDWLNGNGPVN